MFVIDTITLKLNMGLFFVERKHEFNSHGFLYVKGVKFRTYEKLFKYKLICFKCITGKTFKHFFCFISILLKE